MPSHVRVRDNSTGHEYSLRSSAVTPEVHTVIDSPAVDLDGHPLPPRYGASPKPEPPKALARKEG